MSKAKPVADSYNYRDGQRFEGRRRALPVFGHERLSLEAGAIGTSSCSHSGIRAQIARIFAKRARACRETTKIRDPCVAVAARMWHESSEFLD